MTYDNSEVPAFFISNATARNWKKLNTSTVGRLTSRANKQNSQKRIFPLEYISNNCNIAFVQNTLDYIDRKRVSIMSAMLSLGVNLLKRANLYEKPHVSNVLAAYSDIQIIDELTVSFLPDDEFDLLGLIYQSYLQEGQKNISGSYYTPQKIALNMTQSFDFSNGEIFLDPCCGSGAFLLSVSANDPNQLFGVDNDPVAVLIAKINMLLKYKDREFAPQIYCFNFLGSYSDEPLHPVFKRKFDYIATNPPWGAADNCGQSRFSDTFSYFFVKAFHQLNPAGTIRFLFPEAILNVKAHKGIREFILNHAGLIGITFYNDFFSGVTTKYVDITCGQGASKDCFDVYDGNKKSSFATQTIRGTSNLTFNLLSSDDLSIIQAVKSSGRFTLKNSTWGLGIVTGDNKRKLSSERLDGMEKIYTGKEVQPYRLKPAKKFILYDRSSLQQVAKEEIYRAPEKLAYKFISNKLIFAYDNSSSLFLNSANLLIPQIPSMSTKTVMAFLNSSLFQFMYIRLFGETKILKGNLLELPFPKISEEANELLTSLADEVLLGDSTKTTVIENYIFSIYGLNAAQINYVRSVVNGKTDS